MSDLLEIQNRILALENEKKKIEDLFNWRQNESPKLSKELEALKLELHELRKLLNPPQSAKTVETPAEEKKAWYELF